jgi:voltage-gated potassium channel
MKNSRSQHLSRALDGVAIIASILLLISLSLDIVTRRSYILSPGVEELQLVVCMVFVMDFVVQTMTARKPKRFFARNIVLLVVSIPYLNMLHWGGVELPKGLYILLKCLPLVRGGVGIYQLVRLVAPSRVSAILWSYITMIVLLTYLSALVFYAYEEGTNRAITDFSSALWWAGLNVTTVGAPMFAATAVGRVLTVILPGLGMILFPLLTVYVTHLVQLPRKDRRPAR